MTELREFRRSLRLGQREFANLLAVPLETLRAWDSGRRPAPERIVAKARIAVDASKRQHELLPLRQLAKELGVHVRTLQAAARAGRLQVAFSNRSPFGRPMRVASRKAGAEFIAGVARRIIEDQNPASLLSSVPDDFDQRLRDLRQCLSMTQGALAARIGAASKAVIYQWEARKRRPSQFLWRRVHALQ